MLRLLNILFLSSVGAASVSYQGSRPGEGHDIEGITARGYQPEDQRHPQVQHPLAFSLPSLAQNGRRRPSVFQGEHCSVSVGYNMCLVHNEWLFEPAKRWAFAGLKSQGVER